jgi:hypothetical protein
VWRRRHRLQRLETELAEGKAERAELRRRLDWFEAIAAAAGASGGNAVPAAPLPASLVAAGRDQRMQDVAVRLDVAGTEVIAVVGGAGIRASGGRQSGASPPRTSPTGMTRRHDSHQAPESSGGPVRNGPPVTGRRPRDFRLGCARTPPSAGGGPCRAAVIAPIRMAGRTAACPARAASCRRPLRAEGGGESAASACAGKHRCRHAGGCGCSGADPRAAAASRAVKCRQAASRRPPLYAGARKVGGHFTEPIGQPACRTGGSATPARRHACGRTEPDADHSRA